MTDLVDLLNAPAAIVGTTGAGKTFAAKGAVEELLRLGRRVVIIDPTGAWYGLRSGADGGTGGGFPVLIFGGDHADIDITEHSGSAIAEAIAGRAVQAIIDTSEMTGGEKTRFLTDFLQTIYAKNKAALHLIVDEADEVCPQNPMPEERRLSGAFDKIVRRGRIKGFRPLMITQRPAVLHKNVLSQIGTLVALKLTSPQDRKAIEGWVAGNSDADQAKDVITSLPRLGRGEGWVWSPAAGVLERRAFPPITTFDSSRTPEGGETLIAPALSPVDVEGLREAMLETRPSGMGEKIAANASEADLEAAEKRGRDAGYRDGYAAGEASARREAGQRLMSFSADFALWAGDSTPKAAPPAPPDRPVASEATEPAPRATVSASGATKSEKSVKTSTDPLLAAALSVWPAKLTWGALAAMCGRKARGGHFNTVRKRLLDDLLVAEEGDLVVPLNPPEHPAGVIPADLLEQNLPQPAAKMFAAIRQHPGITPVGLASVLQMQPRGGHWNTGMSILRKSGLIDERGNDLRIAPELLGAPHAAAILRQSPRKETP